MMCNERVSERQKSDGVFQSVEQIAVTSESDALRNVADDSNGTYNGSCLEMEGDSRDWSGHDELQIRKLEGKSP